MMRTLRYTKGVKYVNFILQTFISGSRQCNKFYVILIFLEIKEAFIFQNRDRQQSAPEVRH